MVQHLKYVDPPAEDALLTARAILAVATNPQIELSVADIAMHAGMTVDSVRRVLNSPLYQNLLEQEVKMLVAGSLTRGIRAMDKIVSGEKSTDMAKIAAHRANIQAFQALTGAKQQAHDDDSTELLLNTLREIGKAKP